MPPGRRSRLREASLQVSKEVGIADRDRSFFRQPHLSTGQRAEDRKRHCQPMIQGRLYATAWRLLAALDMQIAAAGFCLGTHCPQVCGDELQPIALLHTELADFSEHRRAAR